MTTRKSVIVKDFGKVFEEYPAVGAITPGMLIEYTSAGKVQPHSTSGGNALKMVALEDELQGKTISEAYAAEDQVQCWIPQRGGIALMRIANGQTIAVGDLLQSGGSGYLNKYVADAAESNGDVTVYPEQIVGQALEAVDMSDSSAADPDGLIEVRIY